VKERTKERKRERKRHRKRHREGEAGKSERKRLQIKREREVLLERKPQRERRERA
jgi:hypothetical protein